MILWWLNGFVEGSAGQGMRSSLGAPDYCEYWSIRKARSMLALMLYLLQINQLAHVNIAMQIIIWGSSIATRNLQNHLFRWRRYMLPPGRSKTEIR